SRKVIKPTSLEIESNPRSRSARLRIAERLN
ncbi:MAG: 16S rRNA (cytosine(1402)-N(4))-methyltransferase, partial [Dehalococcoidia bacterium]|nr:16S rRNA (cytosine(1402)-N(4))-methyltransferase [Dehalococcoidia bacterium]